MLDKRQLYGSRQFQPAKFLGQDKFKIIIIIFTFKNTYLDIYVDVFGLPSVALAKDGVALTEKFEFILKNVFSPLAFPLG